LLASSLLLGLLLGIRHAGDADHVATIATVVVGRSNLLGAIRTAILWGLGHSLTFFAVGLAIVVFGLHLPAEFETGVELAIACSLLVLGGIQLVRARQNQVAQKDPHASKPLLLGSLHGLAGSAGVALLALAAIQSKHEALLYLVLFALGTMIGMAAITLLLAWSFRISSSFAWFRRSLVLAAGVISCLCGLSILVQLAA
jgi:nickel/cobalt exporter